MSITVRFLFAFINIHAVWCDDITYLDLSYWNRDPAEDAQATSKYVDVYTNHEDLQDVLESYTNYKLHKNPYQISMPQSYSTNYYDSAAGPKNPYQSQKNHFEAVPNSDETQKNSYAHEHLYEDPYTPHQNLHEPQHHHQYQPHETLYEQQQIPLIPHNNNKYEPQKLPEENSNKHISNRYDQLESEYGVFTNVNDLENQNVKKNNQRFHNNNKYNHRRRPRYKKQNSYNPTIAPTNNAAQENDQMSSYSYIQKIPTYHSNYTNIKNENTKKTITGLLKNYFNKLYVKRYSDTDSETSVNHKMFDDEGRSKIFDENSLWFLKNKTVKFANKFLSLFTIVQFPNSQCTASSASTYYEGTCYHASECEKLEGTPLGNCANEYGVCCVFKYSCGSTSSQNCSYFESPGYPNYIPSDGNVLPPTVAPPVTTINPSPTPDPRLYWGEYRGEARQSSYDTAYSLSCTFSVFKASDDIQQMRIDFIDLELMGPTAGTCINEQLVISGQNINDQIPVICGYNTGQHVYVDVSTLNGPLQISVLANVVSRKRYKLRICQLETNCANNMNCLQYYTGVTGVISSFNYDQAAAYNRSTPGYFNNLNYAICIRKEAGYCSITYTNTPNGIEYPFQLRNIASNGASTTPTGQAGVEVFNCPDDYLVIDGVRVCGDKLNDGSITADLTINAPVTDTSAGPIIIPVRTNNNVTGRGFKLFYTQNICPNSY